MTKKAQSLSIYRPKVLILGIYAPYNDTGDIESYFEEFIKLIDSNEIEYDQELFIKLRDIDPATFITKGKVEQIAKLCQEHAIDHVILSEPLTAQQERNLTDLLRAKVFDRNQLILDIFEKNATTAEGKVQVSIAMLQHKKSRLAGKGIGMAQQAGVLGLRGGFGETAKEKERRHLENEIHKLKKQLKQMQQTRETQRKRRIESNLPLICLVGYTNAGKSTILNALTKSEVLAQDRLFATLDTTVRSLFLHHEKRALISDTVGFIQLLPPKLIEAFKSTLSELEFADLLINVVDISDPNWEEHIEVVENILDDLELDKETLYVFNKIDKVEELTPRLQDRIDRYQPNVIISAESKNGIKKLVDFLDWWTKQKNKK